jgi:hypothetical protein
MIFSRFEMRSGLCLFFVAMMSDNQKLTVGPVVDAKGSFVKGRQQWADGLNEEP